MIYAHFVQTDDRFKEFTLSGHAESGPAGHDLVCAAASAVAIGTTNNLYRMVSIEPKVEANEDEGGFLKVTLPAALDDTQREHAQILLLAMYNSLLDIEEEYGEFISVSKITND